MANKFQPDARWSCQSCGACCRGFSFGPVEQHIIQNLKDNKIEELWEPAKEEWFVLHPQKGTFFFTHKDGHCVFLQKDNLCAIHALFGSEAKPWFCREYPFHVIADSQGLNISVREDCGGFHKSLETGESVESQLGEILSIQREVPYQKFDPKQVVILPGLAVSVENWMMVEPVLLGLCRGDSIKAVGNLRQNLYRMAQRSGPPSDAEAFVQSVKEGVYHLAENIRSLTLPPVMEDAQQWVLRILEGEFVKPKMDSAVERYWSQILYNRILSKSFARLGSLPAGMGLFLMEVCLFSSKDQSLDVVGPQMARWRRSIVLPPLWQALKKTTPRLVDLFMYV